MKFRSAVTRTDGRTDRPSGLLTAIAAVATMGDPSGFRSGREFAAFLGLAPRHSGTRGRVRVLGISKRGDRYLRTLFILGARGDPSHRMQTFASRRTVRRFRLAARPLRRFPSTELPPYLSPASRAFRYRIRSAWRRLTVQAPHRRRPDSGRQAPHFVQTPRAIGSAVRCRPRARSAATLRRRWMPASGLSLCEPCSEKRR